MFIYIIHRLQGEVEIKMDKSEGFSVGSVYRVLHAITTVLGSPRFRVIRLTECGTSKPYETVELIHII